MLYILNLILVLILENRDPYKTLAWILVLLFLPVIGTIAYFYGGESIKRKFYSWKLKRQKYARIAQEIVEAQKESLMHEHIPKEIKDKRHTMYLALHSTQFPFSNNNDVKILNHGKDFFESLFKDIENAKETIHLEYYIFRYDELGKKLADLLIVKADQGVKIRILVDALGSFSTPSDLDKLFKNNNISFSRFLPVHYSFLRSKINHRCHRKICIIDGKIGYIGGINIGQEYLDGGKFGFWRDMQMRIEGPSVYSLQSIFIRDWGFSTKENIYNYKLYPKQEEKGEVSLHISPSGPDTKLANLKLIIFSIITTSEKRLWIETPYFIPDDALLMAIKSTVLKGVDVRLIVPDKSDATLPRLASSTFFKDLLDVGVKIYKYKKGFLHTKLLISDNISSIGSTNLDSRSLNLDFEASAFIFDAKTTNDLVKIFEEDIENSKEITKKDIYAESKWSRFKASLARLVSPIL